MLAPLLNNYGLGVDLDGKGPTLAFGYSGASTGYHSTVFAYAGQGDGAVVMTNSDSGAGLARDLIRSIAAEYNWPSYQSVERSAVRIDPKTVRALAGRYRVKDLGDFKITASGGQLKLWLHPGESETMYAQSPTVFFLLSRELELHLKEAGDPTSGRLVSRAFDVQFTRIK